MEFEIKDLNPTKKAISFKFFKEEIEKEKTDVVNKIKRMATLPGFRPGKVPPEIIKARFKKEIEEDILGNLIEKNVKEILKEKEWKLIGEVIFQEKAFEEDFFKAEVEFYILP
ncbi:MAG: trigger factor family protein, partial [Thermoanaerobaculia bacterium]